MTATDTERPVPATGTPLLSLRGIEKSFGAVHVLQGVDFDIHPGKVTALVGDNGAGKSTLIKGIAGIHAFDKGEYFFDGEPVNVHSPRDANALGIEVVYQDLALCDNLDVVHNMFLGREQKKLRPARRARDGDASPHHPRRALGAHPAVRPHAGRRRSPVASGRRWPSRAPCCGTPRSSSSTSRPPRWASPRPSRCSRWSVASPTTASGSCLISHNLNDVFQVADDIAVLYLGNLVETVSTKDVTSNQVVELITTGQASGRESGRTTNGTDA